MNKCRHTEPGVCPDCGDTVIVPARSAGRPPRTPVRLPERPVLPWTPPRDPDPAAEAYADAEGLAACEGCGGRFLPEDMSCDWPELCLDCAEAIE